MAPSLPSLAAAHELFEKMRERRRAEITHLDEEVEKGFYEHCLGVAYAAQIIASHSDDLNPEKAYILGLLHDYGKRLDEKSEKRFHGNVGFDDMNAMGYSEVARTCLTHSFLIKDFEDRQYNYPQKELDYAREKLLEIEYDDYDYLIQFSDMIVNNMKFMHIKKRIRNISNRYNISIKDLKLFFRKAMELKTYFDNKCGCDIYNLLGINKYE